MKKLQNKKTGMIGEVGYLVTDLATGDGKIIVSNIYDQDEWYGYDSLSKLNEEWQDYEEPKDFWFIDDEGDVEVEGEEYEENLDKMKSIGNYFETEEEAEKAVEKLQALTEAKEDGLKIKGYYYNHEDLVILADIGKCNKLTLDTLFGKEID